MHIQQSYFDQDALSYLAERNKDAYDLISQIMGNVQIVEGCPDIKSVLPYCEIIIKTPMPEFDGKDGQTVYVLMKGANKTGPDYPVTFTCFEQLVAYIMKRWW